MTDEVGRQQGERESVAHSSARADRVIQPTRKQGRIKEVSTMAENHREPVLESELEIHSEPNTQHAEHGDRSMSASMSISSLHNIKNRP
jgi:hypothetical protein